MDLKDFLLKYFKNISWRDKTIQSLFRCMDFPDWVIRRFNGLSYLPKYSIRVRSTGIEKQFGGKRLVKWGETVAGLLADHASLQSGQGVLEIGCGCGSAAFALTRILENETYIGTDIDRISIESCRRNELFKQKRFRFDWMDVHHPMYNPEGKIPAPSYRFPYADGRFDVIFLISVFTHMLPEDVQNYIREFGRMLRPGGKCLVTTFLMDSGYDGYIDFPYDHGDYRLHQEIVPEKAVGYYQAFFERHFQQNHMRLMKKPLLGQWRKTIGGCSDIVFGQDVLIFINK